MGSAVQEVADRLRAGGRVLLVGERGSGRTTTAREAVALLQQELARGSGLRLVDRSRFPLETAYRGEAPDGTGLLVVEDVQWADAATLAELAAHDGPALLTGLPGTKVEGAVVVALLPLTDEEALELGADQAVLPRAGGNHRLLRTLVPGEVPSGPAARTVKALWEGLDEQERHQALLAGLEPSVPIRVGAVGELAVALADEDGLVAAHAELSDLLTDPARRAPHLLAAGRPDEARAAAIAALDDDPRRTADLLDLAERVAPLDEALSDLRATALWRSGQVDRLLETCSEPRTEAQRGAVVKALTSRGEAFLGTAPAGALARAALARGELSTQAEGDVDAQLAFAASELARGTGLSPVDPGDEEQQLLASRLGAVAAFLTGGALAGDELAVVALTTEREGASRERAEQLAELLARTPTGWGAAALAVCLAELGDAQEAEATLDAARATSAFDRQLLALARAEVALTTGRPRVALRALDGTPWWPALEPVAASVAHRARLTVGEEREPAPEPLLAVSRRRQRWHRAETADVDGLRELESEAQDAGLLPLLARVRELLRRRGIRTARGTSAVTGVQGLSARETEVLVLVRDGLTSAQIATRLGVAQSTVETQVASAMRKLGARTRRHAVALLDAS